MSPDPSVSLQQAIAFFYDIAVVQQKTTSTLRLQQLARYCVQALAHRGLTGAEREAVVPGGGRPKQWDVAWKYHAKYRLAVSLKSILRNLAGTVPNRVDDLMGEVTNIQMYSPEVVVGYLMVFDVSRDIPARQGGAWCDILEQRLFRLSGRKAPAWSVGTIESFAIIRVDFSSGPRLLTPEGDILRMFDELVSEVKGRNPSLLPRDI
jgi:hypothetical protein